MLAVAERSVVLLVNPDSDRLARLPAQFRTRIQLSRALLRHFVQVSKASLRLLGDVGDAAASFRSLPNCQIITGDALSFWRDDDVGRRLGPPDTQVVYIGGAWLDQDVLGAALSAGEMAMIRAFWLTCRLPKRNSIGPGRLNGSSNMMFW
jgi:hypothetical protein